jgi:hypothetical protein
VGFELRALVGAGVDVENGADRSDALDLGRYRHTDEWAERAESGFRHP